MHLFDGGDSRIDRDEERDALRAHLLDDVSLEPVTVPYAMWQAYERFYVVAPEKAYQKRRRRHAVTVVVAENSDVFIASKSGSNSLSGTCGITQEIRCRQGVGAQVDASSCCDGVGDLCRRSRKRGAIDQLPIFSGEGEGKSDAPSVSGFPAQCIAVSTLLFCVAVIWPTQKPPGSSPRSWNSPP